MEFIYSGTILKIERVLRENAERGKFCVQEVLAIVKEHGFYSCFFYDAIHNVSTEDYKLFLSAVEGTAKQKSHIGLSVNYRSTAIFRTMHRNVPVIQCKDDRGQSDELRNHTELVDVRDKNRIHIPVYYKEMLIGALSCSWDGECELITEEHKDALLVIASLFSRYWYFATDVLISKISSNLSKELSIGKEKHDINVFLEKTAKLIQSALDARIAAVFHYNWYSFSLSKVVESYSPSLKGDYLKETYRVGERLTGTAWLEEKYRQVVNFEEFLSTYDFHVDAASLDHHNKLLGNIKSVLYCPMGTKSKYFLRIMNREDKREFPFFISHKIVLDKICERLGRIVDEAVTENRIFNLQLVSKTAITNIEDVSKIVECMKDALAEECINEIGIMAYNDKYHHFSHKIFTDEMLQKSMSGFLEWKKGSFYAACVAATDITALKMSEFSERTSSGHLVNVLYKKGVTFVIVIPFLSLRVKGFILIPSPNNIGGSASSFRDRIPTHHISSLKAYAAVIGGCIESAESHLTSENARRLVGQIGHEIQGPVAELGQTSIDVIYKVMEFVSIQDESTIKEKDDIARFLHKNEYIADQQMRQISTLMDVAVDMAQESHGMIQVHFESYSLYDVMLSASREASRDQYLDYKNVRHKVRFEFNGASKGMKNIVGDSALIRRVFVNIFRNAIKYSLPRYRGQPIVIKIHGNPQRGLFIVRIINWGIPIPETIREKIFNSFERGDSYDQLKARRGMGLGLYIARRFLAAHKGDIFCVDSVPTLDDPNRRNHEGFETTFEVRLPHDLATGTYDDFS